MVVRDLDIVGMPVLPAKADTIPLVDADAMVTRPLPLEPFEVIPNICGPGLLPSAGS